MIKEQEESRGHLVGSHEHGRRRESPLMLEVCCQSCAKSGPTRQFDFVAS